MRTPARERIPRGSRDRRWSLDTDVAMSGNVSRHLNGKDCCPIRTRIESLGRRPVVVTGPAATDDSD
jgi:hypothetical protein